jgi:adenylate cyclase
MRIRRLHQRARPFRFAAFWLMGGLCLLLAAPAPGGLQRTQAQVLFGVGFCLLWPWLVDRLLRRRPSWVTVERFAMLAYAAECAIVAAAFAWISLPPLAGVAALLCLLCGAAALAGWRLLLPSAALLLLGAGWGAWLAPVRTAATTAAVDGVAIVQMLGFALALAHVSFRQAQRLDAHRLALTERSAALERANDRLQRYLPPSLRARIDGAIDEIRRSERRWLTVVFVDLVGFTELSARLDAEALADVLDEYLAALVGAAERRGGEVSKLLGDGVMVVFDAPSPAERRAQAVGALTFCREVPALLGQLETQWRARGDLVRLQMRAGVASGFCTLGDRGGAGRFDFTLIGPPVNLASRLEGHAPVDGVLMDAATAALAEQSFSLEPPCGFELKGLGLVQAHGLNTQGSDGQGSVDRQAPSVKVPAPVTDAETLAHATPKDV